MNHAPATTKRSVPTVPARVAASCVTTTGELGALDPVGGTIVDPAGSAFLPAAPTVAGYAP